MGRLKFALLVLMAALYVTAGVLHFVNPGFYLRIMPPWIPWHGFMVAASGVAEIALGAGLLLPATRRWAAWGVVAMLAVFMLVHVHMMLNPGDYPGVAPAMLVLRTLLQFPLMLWAWWYTRPELTRAAG
ncbi:MAG: hypothetical protein RLZZ303_2851 [Candidatus Hydrogenedentota bacterium]|jgi:uncharacterized membrane protein